MLNPQVIVVIYAHQNEDFLNRKSSLIQLGVADSQIIWCSSTKRSRLEIIFENPGSWLFFIDADCEPCPDTIVRINHIAGLNQTAVIAGVYANPRSAKYLQKAHNLIGNLWVKQSSKDHFDDRFFLGGVFLVAPALNLKAHNPIQSAPLFWGAEDLWLAQQLKSLGYPIIFDAELTVVHHTSYSAFHFFRRAWLQGWNHGAYIGHKKSYRGILAKYSFLIRQIGWSNFLLWPAILTHFCIQKWAKLSQRILLKNKSAL